MRWLLLTADYMPDNWSGIGVAVAHQAQALTDLGHEVHVLLASPFERAASERVHLLRTDKFPIAVRRDDIVHVHSLRLAELAIELARRFGVRLFYTVHSLETGSARWRCKQRELFRHADWNFFLNEDEREASGIERSSVLPNGVPNPPSAIPPFINEGPIVFAGRFSRDKGVDIARAIVRMLPERQFVFAGGHGDADQVVPQQSNCRVAGWLGRPALDQLFARAAMVIVPSRYEPFGMVALEAMRMGAPVLAADVGGLRDIVTPESGGQLIADHHPEHWARACNWMFKNIELRKHLHQRGPEYVAAKFNIHLLAANLVSYTQLRLVPGHGSHSPLS